MEPLELVQQQTVRSSCSSKLYEGNVLCRTEYFHFSVITWYTQNRLQIQIHNAYIHAEYMHSVH